VTGPAHNATRQPITAMPPSALWQANPPDKPGCWWMLCGECDGEPELVHVEHRRGDLWAVDCEIGSLPVKMYHDGLTNCLWQEAVMEKNEFPKSSFLLGR